MIYLSRDKEDFNNMNKMKSLKKENEESRNSTNGYLERGNPKELAQEKRARSSGFK